MKVGILGGGRWGQALARLALAAGNEPLIAYRDKKEKPPHLLPSTQDPPEVSRTCDLLIAATSATELQQAI
jgi:glycerol-3-phosphate dehydrogenase